MATESLEPRASRATIPGHVLVALGLVYAIWSSTYLAIRVVVHDLPPLSSGGVRYVTAGAVLLAFARAWAAIRRQPFAWPSLRQWLAALPVGALLFAVGNGLVASAERSIGSGVAAVVCGTTPLWAAVVGRALGDRTGGAEWLGLVAGFAGVLVLGLGGELDADPGAAALLCLAPIGWAFGSLGSTRLPLASGAAGAATQMITGGLVLLVAGRALGEAWPDEAPPAALAALAYLVVAGSLVGFTAYHHLLAHARPALAMSYAYVNPVLAVGLGALLGGEAVGRDEVLAALLIGGAVVALVRGKTAPSAPAPSTRG